MRQILCKLENLVFNPCFSSLFFPPIFRLAFLFCKTPRPGGRRSARSYSLLSAIQATALRPAALRTPDKESRNSRLPPPRSLQSPPPPHRQPPPSPPSPATPPRGRARPAPAADARPRTRPWDLGAAGAPIPGRSRRGPPTAGREAGTDRPILSA